jgi:hypothetical protein
MLNIYRVISLSLVMSLFFAAPLLCVKPVSFRLKKEKTLASKLRQAERMKVGSRRGSDKFYSRGSDGLAQSLLRARTVKDDVLEDNAIIPVVFVEEQDEYWDRYEQERGDTGQTADFGRVSTVSNASL